MPANPVSVLQYSRASRASRNAAPLTICTSTAITVSTVQPRRGTHGHARGGGRSGRDPARRRQSPAQVSADRGAGEGARRRRPPRARRAAALCAPARRRPRHQRQYGRRRLPRAGSRGDHPAAPRLARPRPPTPGAPARGTRPRRPRPAARPARAHPHRRPPRGARRRRAPLARGRRLLAGSGERRRGNGEQAMTLRAFLLGLYALIACFIGIYSFIMPGLTRRDVFFGVTVAPDARATRAGRRILAGYRAAIAALTLLALALIAAAYVLLPDDVLATPWVVLGVLALALFVGVPYLFAHVAARKLAAPRDGTTPPSAAQAAELRPRRYGDYVPWPWELLPLLLIAATVAYLASQYASAPSVIPTHFNN